MLKNIFPGLSGNGLNTPIISTEAELNKLSGLTSTTTELNVLSGMSSSTTELNILTGVTKTTAEINAFLIPSEVVNLIYPIGAIYCSASSTSPATLFGVGVWTALADKQTLVQQGTYAAGSSGGSSTAINVSHTHTQQAHSHSYDKTNISSFASDVVGSNPLATGTPSTTTGAATPIINSSGASGANANMPPYLSVYMWQRTA